MLELLGSIFRNLDISAENGLATSDQQDLTVYQRQFYLHVKEKLGVDAVYFLRDNEGVPKTPLIYFSCMDSYDADSIAQIHRLSWNTGEAPLLFVVLPDQLLIFSNYIQPKKKDGKLDPNCGLIEKITWANELERQRKLEKYSRYQLETGEYWRKNSDRFDVRNRIDMTLLNNLKILRKKLIQLISSRHNSELSEKKITTMVHGILGRSILIKYLEERNDSQDNRVFPPDFFEAYTSNARSYSDVLMDKDATYRLYEELEKHFHGDIFPLIENEREIVSTSDLAELKLFLDGDIDLRNNQFTLWSLYSFNVIPIQLISGIYEMFFHMQENEDEKGTYYTPFHLVEMLTDEVFPWEAPFKKTKVLDPACGSGIFLVEIYRRLIGQWMHFNKTTKMLSEQLIDLLETSIYGVDSNDEAIRIASFSLCLTMCDYLEPRCIWDELEFPNLKSNNLFHNDFFVDCERLEKFKYDLIIGNPPWENRLSEEAIRYINRTGHPIGDHQIAQAFTWKAAELCSEEGSICFLMPSKGFLFNRSGTNEAFRREFFTRFRVSVIINFSAFRKVLFEHASGPATGVVFLPKRETKADVVYYCTPKPLYTVEDRRRFFVEPMDICRIPNDMVGNDLIWKIAMWGGPRDLDLISKIQANNENIESIAEKDGMQKAEGFKRGNQKNSCEELLTMPMVWAKDIQPYTIAFENLTSLDWDGFERVVSRKQDIFRAPHLLIKQSPVMWRFRAAFLEYDAVFNHSILGIHGESSMLKYLCLIVNSKIFSYYQIMTSRRWMVERDELEADEILSMPVPYPSKEVLDEASRIYGMIIGNELMEEDECQWFINSQYRLTDYEIELVNDAINYTFDSFNKKANSYAFALPDNTNLTMYSNAVCDILNNSIASRKVRCDVYQSTAPLAVARVSFDGDKEYAPFLNSTEIDELLLQLDKLLIEQKSQSVFVRRNVRIYEGGEAYIVKPNQKKYWTYSSACRDADEIYADVMRAWRYKNE